MFERDAFLSRYPQFRVRKDEVVLVNHKGGLVYPEKCIEAFLKDAEEHGAKILENARVLRWSEEATGVRI